MQRRSARLAFAALALGGLTGCELPVAVDPPSPAAIVAAPPPPTVKPSALSEATRSYFAGIQMGLLQHGQLRTDGGGPDTPFTDRNLAENFLQIALFDEYAATGGQFVARTTPSTLRRWEKPVRLSVEFGATVPDAQRARDREAVARYAGTLATATGHPISLDDANANFHVLVLNEDDRRAAAPRLRALVPGIAATDIATITNMPRSTFCLVFAFSRDGTSTYDTAVAIIRGEHPDLLRLSCIHEELAQGLGLANDSPDARPSIFNDDEEFALLTRQDALLLKMLFDPRLTPGMMIETARPIAQIIASELLGPQS